MSVYHFDLPFTVFILHSVSRNFALAFFLCKGPHTALVDKPYFDSEMQTSSMLA